MQPSTPTREDAVLHLLADRVEEIRGSIDAERARDRSHREAMSASIGQLTGRVDALERMDHRLNRWALTAGALTGVALLIGALLVAMGVV